jgi:hypothetical protein
LTPLNCLFVLSADFGEFVTANLFSRGQPFTSHIALPEKLARHVPPGMEKTLVYRSVTDIERQVDGICPDIVVLCAGYLFAVNGLITPERLAAFVEHLRNRGIRVMTTDPWLGIWQTESDARFEIYSVSKGQVDQKISQRMNALQKYLNALFRDIDHLYAVPLDIRMARSYCFFNSEFNPVLAKEQGSARKAHDDWLMVLSREDYVYLAGAAPKSFLATLDARIDDIVSNQNNRLTFIGPRELEDYFKKKSITCDRVSFRGFCDFIEFETLLRRVRVVIYWNVLSSSLLYCLYYRVAPVFFGTGHQAKVCRGLLGHVVRNVYSNDAPPILDPSAALEADVDTLLDQLQVMPWLDRLRGLYAGLPGPAEILSRSGDLHE